MVGFHGSSAINANAHVIAVLETHLCRLVKAKNARRQLSTTGALRCRSVLLLSMLLVLNRSIRLICSLLGCTCGVLLSLHPSDALWLVDHDRDTFQHLRQNHHISESRTENEKAKISSNSCLQFPVATNAEATKCTTTFRPSIPCDFGV